MSEEKRCTSEEKGCMSEEKRCTSEEKGCMSEDKTEAAALFLRGLSLMKARECDLKRNIRQFLHMTRIRQSQSHAARQRAACQMPRQKCGNRKRKSPTAALQSSRRRANTRCKCNSAISDIPQISWHAKLRRHVMFDPVS